jgi:hypothetical protein
MFESVGCNTVHSSESSDSGNSGRTAGAFDGGADNASANEENKVVSAIFGNSFRKKLNLKVTF